MWAPCSLELNDQIADAILLCEDKGQTEAVIELTRHDCIAIDSLVRADMKDASGRLVGRELLLKIVSSPPAPRIWRRSRDNRAGTAGMVSGVESRAQRGRAMSAPVVTPVHAPVISPDVMPWPDRYTDPERICPEQKRSMPDPSIEP